MVAMLLLCGCYAVAKIIRKIFPVAVDMVLWVFARALLFSC